MKAVSNYKAMIVELGRVVNLFANYTNFPFNVDNDNLHYTSKDMGWTSDNIAKLQGKVEKSLDMADKIKDEIIGDGDEAKFVGRLKTALFELNGDPTFAPSYFPEFDEDIFDLPSKDNPDKNKELLDSLAVVYGNEAGMLMVSLQSICRFANLIVENVCKTLDDVCKFVGYTTELKKEPQERDNNSSLTDTIPEPQRKPKPTRGKGRPKETLKDKMIDDANGQKLQKMHSKMDDKKGKDFALLMLACIKKGWLTRPTCTQAKNEFGDIGSKTGYNKYLNEKMFTKEEIEGAINSLD